MEFIESIYNIVPEMVWELISLVGSAFAILFLYFSSKYRNHELTLKWYILAFFFPLITSIVYLSKRKRYDRNIGMKVCPSCGDKYPSNFQICSRCLVELPEVNEKKNSLNKKLSTVFLCLFIAVFILDLVGGAAVVGYSIKEWSAELDEISESLNEYPERISFEDSEGDIIYYDRNGEKNYDNLDFPLYDRNGNVYYFVLDEGKMGFYKDDGKDNWNDANFILNEDCFVDEEGYFVILDGDDPVKIVEEGKEINYYFDTPYTDGKGNLYYPALSASWNEKGELITSAKQIQ